MGLRCILGERRYICRDPWRIAFIESTVHGCLICTSIKLSALKLKGKTWLQDLRRSVLNVVRNRSALAHFHHAALSTAIVEYMIMLVQIS